MGSGHTHRGGRRFNPRRGAGGANGTRGAATPENTSAETANKKPPSSGTPQFAPRPPRMSTPPPFPSAHPNDRGHDAGRVGGPQRANERARQNFPMSTGPQPRPFVQMPDPRQGPEQRARHQMRADATPPRTSGTHPRPNDHAVARRPAPADEALPLGPTHTRPHQHAPQAQPGTASDNDETGPSGTPVPPDGLSRASDDREGTPDASEPEAEPDGYRHTQHEPVRPEVRGDVGPLIEALHEIFERDRGVASQGTSARCGICYLHFALAELQYRDDEGFYVCAPCGKALGHAQVFMVRRQQK